MAAMSIVFCVSWDYVKTKNCSHDVTGVLKKERIGLSFYTQPHLIANIFCFNLHNHFLNQIAETV